MAAGEDRAEPAESVGTHGDGAREEGGCVYFQRRAERALAPPPLKEDPLSVPARFRLPAFAAAATLALSACDRQPEAIIVPEFDFAFSFETGLGGWTVAQADLGTGTGSIAITSADATDGSNSVRLSLTNPAGTGKVWMTRELEVTPDQSYSVEVSFDLSTGDHGTVDSWKLVVGLRDAAPTGPAGLDFQGDTSTGSETGSGTVWVEKSFTMAAKADDEGRLFFTLGLWGTSAGSRSFAMDNVRVVLTRI